MSRTASPSSGKPYGVAAVCRTWGLARTTVYRHLAPVRQAPPRRPGPIGPMPDPDLVEAIRRVLHDMCGRPVRSKKNRQVQSGA